MGPPSTEMVLTYYRYLLPSLLLLEYFLVVCAVVLGIYNLRAAERAGEGFAFDYYGQCSNMQDWFFLLSISDMT